MNFESKKLARRFRKPLLIGGVALSVLSAVAYGLFLYAPTYARYKIHERYPYVTVTGPIELHRHTIVLHDVVVDKPNLHGTFPLVTVNIDDKSAQVDGGRVAYTFGEDKAGNSEVSAEKHAITAKGLTVAVRKGTHAAILHNLNVNDREACFGAFTVYKVVGTEDLYEWAAQVDGLPWEQERDHVIAWASDHAANCVDRDKHHAHMAIVYVEASVLGGLTKYIPDQWEPERIGLWNLDFTNSRSQNESMDLRIEHVSSGQTSANDVHLIYWSGGVKPSRVDVGARDLEFVAQRVFNEPITIKSLHTSVDPEHLREQPLKVDVAGVSLSVDPKTYGVSGEEDCNTWLDSLPEELKTKAFDGLRFTGQLGFDVRIKPEVKVALRNTCTAICPVPAIAALKKPFEHTIYVDYGNGDEESLIVAGPNTGGWTPLKDIAPVMPTAVINMEDKAFPTHHGFVTAAIENSLKEDVEKGRFARGGSTISMQLAKNLFFLRSKTIGRKVQEAFMTMALESCLSKDQIMELYLNVVQFGPNLYGIGKAAPAYFHKKPSELTAEEAFYLASILPHPSHASPPNEATMKRVSALMRTLVSRGSLSPDVLSTMLDSDGAQL